jgi:hypothetical protein
VVAVLFELADALHEVVVEHGGLEAKAHDGGDAFGAANSRDALLRLAGPEQDVAREHGLEQRNGALLGFFEFFVQRQIGLKVLLLQVHLGDFFFAGFGVGQVPAVRWRAFNEKLVWRWRVLRHLSSAGCLCRYFRRQHIGPSVRMGITKTKPRLRGVWCVG